MTTTNPRHTERGSALLNVIIAFVMFVALTFGVVNSYRVGGTTQDNEKDVIFAGQVVQYPLNIKTAALRISAGSSRDTDVCFDTPLWGHTNYQHGPAQPPTNNIFQAVGGDTPFQHPQSDWLDKSQSAQPQYGRWMFTGSTCIGGVGAGSDNNCNADAINSELIAILPYVRKGLCVQVNNKLGVNRPGKAQPPQDVGAAWTATPEFDGVYEAGEVIGDAAGILRGVDAGCFKGAGETYHFYSVILQR
jgi:hypothetical protein